MARQSTKQAYSISFETFLESFNNYVSIVSKSELPKLLKEFDDYDTNTGFVIFETLVFLMETRSGFTEENLRDWLMEKCPSARGDMEYTMKRMYEVLYMTFNEYVYS